MTSRVFSKRRIGAAAGILAAATVAFHSVHAQSNPNLISLRFPGLYDGEIVGGKSVVEIPDRPINRMQFLIRNAQERGIVPGRYRIFVNGKGLGNVFEERTTSEGALLVMEPEMLRKRPDEIFDPLENAVEFSAEDRRGRRYYQNWIIRKSQSKRNEFFLYQSVLSPDDPTAIAPDIILEQPAAPIVLPAPTSVLRVKLRGSVSAGASLTIAGQAVLRDGVGVAAAFDHEIAVDARMREIVLQARDRNGNIRKLMIPVSLTQKQGRPPRFAGKKFAVIIGVSRFGSGNGALPPLHAVSADALALADKLESSGGFPKENIRLLLDEKATLEQVRVALSDFAARAAAGDLFVLYLGTYSLHDPRPNKAENVYLAFHGTSPPAIESTALGLTDLQRLLDRSLRSNQCLLFFDVGHKLPDSWATGNANLANNHLLAMLSERKGNSVLVSASGDQLSQRVAGEGAGSVYAHWLAKGLAGEADLDKDRIVTSAELFTFVTENVKTATGGVQQPRFVAAETAKQVEVSVFGATAGAR